MCTVTLICRQKGFALGMNRDEQRTRVQALPPAVMRLAGRRALFPSEPGGGTWIGVNDAAVACALVNWYAITAKVRGPALSRGQVVTAALAATTVKELATVLDRLPLHRVNPFRLIGVFADGQEVVEWRWNLRQLKAIRHPWAAATWISSGFDEPGAQAARAGVFSAARRQRTFGRVTWLRRLHRSHQPERGAYATCMHREDAATVSYTEIVVTPSAATMRYQAGPPCEAAKLTRHHLDFKAARTKPPGQFAVRRKSATTTNRRSAKAL